MQPVTYFGTDIEVQPGDVVKMRRWFRHVPAVVTYVPGISQPNSFFGKIHVGVKTYDQLFYGIIVEERGVLWKTVIFVARGDGPPPDLPDDLE